MIETVRQDPAKLFMLGLDAASLPFIRANAGQLPFLASLVEEGTVADLGSPATHLSASVWPTFYSGPTARNNSAAHAPRGHPRYRL